MKTIYVKPADADRKWYIVDAKDKVLGRVAAQVANVLRGKNKPYFAPHHELGDYVIIINAAQAVVTGGKETKKLYYRYSGQIGGMKSDNYQTLLKRKPFRPLELAIKGMLPHNRLGSKLFGNVKIYGDDRHPHGAQKPEVLEIKD